MKTSISHPSSTALGSLLLLGATLTGFATEHLTGVTVFSVALGGGYNAVNGWDTVPTNAVPNAWVWASGGDQLNGPSDAAAAVSIPLEPGPLMQSYNVTGAPGSAFELYHGINLFFNGSTVPQLSAYQPTACADVSKTGYLFYSENYALIEKKDYQPITVSIPLSPITNDIPVVLRNVFFETNKYNLKDESKAELNKLVDFLMKNPTLKIELSSHTDNVGDKKLNQVLSENRAKSVSEYLAANGIARERLTFKGYGDTKPVVANDSDEHRQMNRRTEFRVVSK